MMKKKNILNQVFKANERNQIWVGDITYIPTKHGWLYLAVFIDIFLVLQRDGLWIPEFV